MQNRVRDRYPTRHERQDWEIQATALLGDSKPEILQKGGIAGYLFLSPDPQPDRGFQSRLDGYTFSKFKPYEAWNPFQAEAKELWDIYTEIAEPVKVERIALRTVNSLNLPLPFGDLREYILTGPEIAPNIPSALAQFFMQVSVPQPGGEIATITTAMQPVQEINPSFVTVIFDIDVFVNRILLPDSTVIWEKCEDMRQIRNDIFFNSLTEKAKGLF